MELLYLMMKKWQKHSINIFETFDKNLSLPENPSIKEPSVELFTDPVILALEKFKRSSKHNVYEKSNDHTDNPKFGFRFVSLNETSDGVDKLNPKKASHATDIPVKII